MRHTLYRLLTRLIKWLDGPEPGQVNYKNHKWGE